MICVRITYVSNFMNHHQLPFSQGILSQSDVNYIFIALEPIPQERLDMGYEDMNHKYPFVLCAYDSAEKMTEAEMLIDNADVAIYGSCPDKLIMRRTSKRKLCFKFSERYFKEGTGLLQIPHNLASAWKHLKPFEKGSLYFCCSSAYTTADLNRYTNYRGRTFKWGYFPETKQYNVAELMKKKMSVTSAGWKHPQASILWVGRLIGWKHPDASIELAASLKKKGYSFKMSIIGNGEMEAQLHEMIKNKGVGEYVEMLGAMSPDNVRVHMEKADIFLFTSDFNEGWGAVLNESMNSGCAVVASHAIGAVPFLIKEGINGLVYENENQRHLEMQVCRLLDDDVYRRKIGENAYYTISEKWNAQIAADRFIELVKTLLQGKEANGLFDDGPCSEAENLSNGWYHANEF